MYWPFSLFLTDADADADTDTDTEQKKRRTREGTISSRNTAHAFPTHCACHHVHGQCCLLSLTDDPFSFSLCEEYSTVGQSRRSSTAKGAPSQQRQQTKAAHFPLCHEADRLLPGSLLGKYIRLSPIYFHLSSFLLLSWRSCICGSVVKLGVGRHKFLILCSRVEQLSH